MPQLVPDELNGRSNLILGDSNPSAMLKTRQLLVCIFNLSDIISLQQLMQATGQPEPKLPPIKAVARAGSTVKVYWTDVVRGHLGPVMNVRKTARWSHKLSTNSVE